jgi:hypothetical protein
MEYTLNALNSDQSKRSKAKVLNKENMSDLLEDNEYFQVLK